MITFLEGILVAKEPTRVEVAVGGIGYEVFIPLSSYDRMPVVEQRCRILTYHHVREDAQVLYGFATEEERRLFVLLLNTVTGIGPRLALSVLSGLSVRELVAAIAGGDIKRLSSVSGIGKKTAERIVVELRDKLSDGEMMAALAPEPESGGDPRLRDALLALISLGYKQADAQKRVRAVIEKAKPGASVEEVVKAALTG
jgi:Holliday junction DNA helicase RuvA